MCHKCKKLRKQITKIKGQISDNHIGKANANVDSEGSSNPAGRSVGPLPGFKKMKKGKKKVK